MGKDRLVAIVLSVILPILVAIGAQFGTIITPIILIIFVIGFIVLVSLDKIQSRNYPIYLFAITLSLMWQTSMLGAHIVGSDMQGEFYSSYTILQNGIWHPSLHYGTQSSTSIVVGWIAPNLANLFNVDVVWIYKVVFPIIFSFTTVILYYAYRKQFGEKKSVLACLFFMIVPIASLEVAQIGKMMVAETFFAVVVLLLVLKLKWYWQLIGLIGATSISMLSHYTVGFAVIAYLGGILLIRLVMLVFKNWSLFKEKVIPVWVVATTLIITVSGCVTYYSIADGGVIMQVMKKVVPVYTLVVVDTMGIGTNKSGKSSSPGNAKAPDVLLPVDKALKEANIPDNYIDKLNDQEVLVKTAIGFDFKDASVVGKIFRIIQYITQLMMIVGGIWLCFNFKKYKVKAEFMAGIIASFILLALCIFVPQFSLIINATRFYQLSLFFLAPIFIIGFDAIWGKKWLLPTVMIVYFIFTSGLVYEATQSNVTNKMDVPYSAGLSAKRTGIYANYTQDDVNAVKWIESQTTKDDMVVSDYNGGLLVSAYMGLGKVRNEGAWYNLSLDNVPDNAYIFLTSWNSETGMYLDSIKGVRGGAGLRATKPLPVLDYPIVYKSGDAIVLKK